MESNIVAVGLSHHTAPLEVREKLAVSQQVVPELLRELRGQGLGREALLLSTCNRVELYAVPGRGQDGESLAAWFAERNGLVPRRTLPFLYRHQGDAAVRHLFRVTSSLDSMVLGEPQIVGQVREAYRVAQESEAAGPVLHKVMDRALMVAKRVRSETRIAREAVSIGRAGVELARQVLGGLESRAAMLIGAGEHGRVVARSLLDYGLSELVVANRTFARGAEVAREFGASAIPLEEMPRYLERVDIVLTSTSAGRLLLERKEIQTVARRRRFKSLVLIDLSVPRNIDPSADDLDGVFRFDIDDLRQVADQGKVAREEAAREAERIVDEEVEKCWAWLAQVEINAGIGAMSRHAEQIRLAELQRAHAVLDRLSEDDRKALDAMTKALVKKLLHEPIRATRQLAEQGDRHGIEVLLGALAGTPAEGAPFQVGGKLKEETDGQ
ncbi:glutamyl-tRNA reductase [Myxococcota bacterium]|nr:glutamyl-tRNA reductase [Myxococcota bacterium]